MNAKQSPVLEARSRTPVPPEERFWQRYSPHNEFSLSAWASLMAHGFLLAVIVVGGYLAVRFGLKDAGPRLAVGPIIVKGDGGSGPSGDGSGAGERKEAASAAVAEAAAPTPSPESLPEIRSPQLAVPRFQERDERSVREESRALFDRLVRNSRDTGAEVADGPSDDDKNKKGTGDTGRIAAVQIDRILRWTLLFNTKDGDDYRKQLLALGAILAVPEKEGGPYRVHRDLHKQPATGEIEDITKIKRIFWIDDKPDSVKSLAGALQLKDQPAHIVAFFPKKLEDELLRKELAFKNRKEKEIKETRFNVVKSGDSYEAVVIDQR